VIVAGGSGRRMGAALPKQFLLLDGVPVLARTVNRIAEAFPGSPVVVVLPADQLDFWRDYAARFEVKRHTLAAGGAERFHSVKAGLEALLRLGEGVEFVAVHDGVRPLASVELLRRTVDCARMYGAAVPVTEPVDSYRRVTDGGSEVVDRRALRIVQTPQVFRTDWLRRAYGQPYSAAFTDDASAVERAGYSIALCEGERSNLKITTREDLSLAAAWLRTEGEKEGEEKGKEQEKQEEQRDGGEGL